ncbi:MAG: hypothetical protein DRN08_00100 [Thermoplasmata archaeon]|nr:MAG: hypothetical protein DRN05_00375 [Thermoplasmata archaeon]RLF37126.1 MAG: hypothetical protein DRN08_00100 [Thermoplasmata archaeon]
MGSSSSRNILSNCFFRKIIIIKKTFEISVIGMRILLATESYYPNIDGGAVAQHRLVTQFIKNGHEVVVIAPGFSFKNIVETNSDGSKVFRVRGIKLPLYMDGRYTFSPFPIFQVNRIIKKFRPDIINICSPYPISISALVCAKKYHIPVVGSIHVLPENMLSPLLRSQYYDTIKNYAWAYLIYFYNLVDWATVPTKTGAEMFTKRGLKTRITPVSNGVDLDVFNPNNDGEYLRKKIGLPERTIVLYTGRISAEKNLDVLIKAIPYVIRRVDAHFLICGSGGVYRQEIIRLAEKIHVRENTTFIDFLDWKDYPNIYSIADVFAIPAESELQSIVTMEALASGLPVVAVNKGALPELVSLNNGLLFEPQNSKQMADHIVRILSDEKLRKDMGAKSLELIKKHSIDYICSQYEKIYSTLTGNVSD